MITLGTDTTGKRVRLDTERLVTSRMLLQANSGGGKSWAIRRLLEQTHGKIQQLVIDPEGEFYTLREKNDYVLAGKGGDCPAGPLGPFRGRFQAYAGVAPPAARFGW